MGNSTVSTFVKVREADLRCAGQITPGNGTVPDWSTRNCEDN